MTSIPGATPRRVERRAERIIERIEHRPAAVVLSWMAWDVEARHYAALHLDPDDFDSVYDRNVYQWLASRPVLDLGSTLDLCDLADICLYPIERAVLREAMAIGWRCREQWPIERAARLLVKQAARATADDTAEDTADETASLATDAGVAGAA